MLSAIRQAVLKHHMLQPGDKAICGVSGGPDSMALLHALMMLQKEIGHMVIAAHLDHGLRPESPEEATFVKEFCGRHGIPFFMEKADIASMADLAHISLEDAGRRARYSFFNRILEEQHASRIAVGHQMQDNAETILWNLMRGSGLNGLCGIRPVQGYIIRPLLFTSREEIVEYLHVNHIPFVNDSSNDTFDYTRNRIRHTLLPVMGQFNANLYGTLSRMALILADDERTLDEATCPVYNTAVTKQGEGLRIRIDPVANAPRAIARRVIRRAVEDICGLKDLTSAQVEAVLDLKDLQPGSCADIHSGLIARREFDTISILKPAAAETRGETPLNLEGVTEATDFHCLFTCSPIAGLPEDLKCHPEHYEYFDADLFPKDAVVRGRREGDRIRPLGCGQMKLKKYLSQKKIPRWDREDIPVIAHGQDILWAAGYGISDTVKVGRDTKRIIRITFN